MKLTTAYSLGLLAMLLAPAARAVNVRPWDSMSSPVTGSIKVTTKSGKTLSGHIATFRPDELFLDYGPPIPRANVEEVAIRGSRSKCCDELWFGALMVAGSSVALAHGDVELALFGYVIFVPVTAVTLPPALVIDAARRLLPRKLLYKVSP